MISKKKKYRPVRATHNPVVTKKLTYAGKNNF